MSKNLVVGIEDETGLVARRPYEQVHVLKADFLGGDALQRMANEAHHYAPVNEPGAVDLAGVRFKELMGMEPSPDNLANAVADALIPTGIFGGQHERYRLAMWKRFDYLTCRGSSFHNDKADGWSHCLFWVLVLDAVDCEMVMPDIGLRLALKPGQLIAFDPQLVHGICRPGDKKRMVKSHFRGDHGHQAFLSGELELNRDDWAALGCPWLPAGTTGFAGAVDLQQVLVNQKTGATRMPGQHRLSRHAMTAAAPA